MGSQWIGPLLFSMQVRDEEYMKTVERLRGQRRTRSSSQGPTTTPNERPQKNSSNLSPCCLLPIASSVTNWFGPRSTAMVSKHIRPISTLRDLRNAFASEIKSGRVDEMFAHSPPRLHHRHRSQREHPGEIEFLKLLLSYRFIC